MKKKILFIGRFPPPVHGASKVNETYFESKLIRDVFYVDKIKINPDDEIENIGKFSFKKIIYTFKAFFELNKKLNNFNPNIVYFELAPTGGAFIRDSLFAILCKIHNKKIIFQLHARGIKEKSKNFLWRRYYKFIFRKTKMILLSNMLYEEVEKVIPIENINILPNGIKNEINEKEYNRIILNRAKNKKKKLLFISNMVEEKGALDVLRICKELDKKGVSFECYFAGPWQEENFENKWKKLIKELKLEEKCKYVGPKYGKDKAKLFSESDFFIFPTKYKNESFPLVILESFMYGIPVLSYNQGAIKEIISDDYLGYVSKNKKYQELSSELLKRISKKSDSKKIREHFKKNYTIETAEENLKEIFYNELK